MNSVTLRVDQAGPLTTIQDAGRPGHRRFGVTPSGPVDRASFAAAHAALGNPPGGAAVELSHGGIVLRCLEGEIGFALAGSDFTARVDAANFGSWTTGVLSPGSCLTIREGRAGNWASLAFAGALAARQWLGSAATLALAGLGGGRLAAGDTLVVAAVPPPATRPIPMPPANDGPIRVVLGPQEQYFAPESIAALLAGPYFAGQAFDRMGLVLDGPALPPLSVTMLSAPLLRGAIQVNGAGTPTILLADHQTTAGYPRIATVIDADVDRAAQVRPGSPLQFAAVTAAEANAIARRAAAARATWLAAVARRPDSWIDRLRDANLIDGVVDAQATI